MSTKITLETLVDFFASTRQSRAAGHMAWDIDGICRWSYFFVDGVRDKLMPVARHLESLGYEFRGTLDPEDPDDQQIYLLRMDRVERHTPQSLHARNLELYSIADRFGIEAYDGMDVGAVDGP